MLWFKITIIEENDIYTIFVVLYMYIIYLYVGMPKSM